MWELHTFIRKPGRTRFVVLAAIIHVQNRSHAIDGGLLYHIQGLPSHAIKDLGVKWYHYPTLVVSRYISLLQMTFSLSMQRCIVNAKSVLCCFALNEFLDCGTGLLLCYRIKCKQCSLARAKMKHYLGSMDILLLCPSLSTVAPSIPSNLGPLRVLPYLPVQHPSI